MKKEIFGTKEWASSTENIMFGCQHDCKYCYAKAMSIRHKKIDINRWSWPFVRKDQLEKNIGTRKGTTMFPSTHDLHPENLDIIIPFLRKLLSVNNKVLIVSKPHPEVIREICDVFSHWSYKKNILFRFTIGSVSNETLKYWEPGAPKFLDRIKSLMIASGARFKTSVSMEPMLDSRVDQVILHAREYVTDSIWLGKMNDPTRRLKINGHSNIPGEFKDGIRHWMNDQNIFDLYERYHDDPMIKWKESIKKIIGLKMPEEKGMDI